MSTDNMSDLGLTSTNPRKKNVVFILFSFICYVLKKKYIFQIRNFKKKKKEKGKKEKEN
jgi:hypothetical protein